MKRPNKSRKTNGKQSKLGEVIEETNCVFPFICGWYGLEQALYIGNWNNNNDNNETASKTK